MRKATNINLVKKGLLIGINYTGTSNQLNGCINDTDNLKNFLISNKYFKDSELIFMNDFKTGNLYPNKQNILLQLDELVKFANNNTDKQVFLFLSYSGHGYYVNDTNNDEQDGKDEVLCPIDCDKNGFIVDDLIKSRLVDKLNSNVTLVVLIDACHSGTVLDLRYTYNCDNTNSFLTYDTIKDTRCNVVMISGCRDDQTSSDAFLPDKITKKKEYQGAMTAAFIDNYKDDIQTKKLINDMRSWLKTKGFDQIPQLTSGKTINILNPFMLSIYN